MANKYLDSNGLAYFYGKLNTKNEEAITTAISEALADFKLNLVTVVASLPEDGEEGKLYLVPNDDGTFTTYTYEEGEFVQIGNGSVSVDLTNYYTKSETDSTFLKQADMVAITNEEIDGIMV